MRQLTQSKALRLQPDRAPPNDYYASNLRVLVRSVVEQYKDLLTESELAYGLSILNLSPDGRRLYARIVGRTVAVLLVEKLQYAEVKDLDGAVRELENCGLIHLNECLPADIVLDRLTVTQLGQAFAYVKPHTPKANYVNSIACRYPDWRLRAFLRSRHPWLTLQSKELLERYLFLFFGNRATDLSAFVTRDLGILRYESYVLNAHDRQFSSREELSKYFEWVSLSDSIAESEVSFNPSRVQTYIDALRTDVKNRTLERYRSRILNRLGHKLERSKHWRLAFRAYRYSKRHPARERMVRILVRTGRQRTATRLKQALVVDPWCKEEEDFARRFQEPRQLTQQYPIDELELARPPQTPIEQHALQTLVEDGGDGWHFENALPLSLFGLAYWEWMYVSVPGAFTNQFQSGPRDLFWPEFFDVRKRMCADPLSGRMSISETILTTAATKRGLANRLVNWSIMSDEILRAVVRAIGDSGLRRLLEIVKSDLNQMRSGFPDLTLVYSDGSYEFVEVKAPGDQVQRNQRIWLSSLVDAGLPVRVLRYSYET